MDLATAIREGARQRPQFFGGMFGRMSWMGIPCSCAQGAAYEGALGRLPEIPGTCGPAPLPASGAGISRALAEMFPVLAAPGRCPAGCPPEAFAEGWNVGRLLIHLNDYHGWSRERIAGWVESL